MDVSTATLSALILTLIQSLDWGALQGITGLKSVTIPSSVTSIGIIVIIIAIITIIITICYKFLHHYLQLSSAYDHYYQIRSPIHYANIVNRRECFQLSPL